MKLRKSALLNVAGVLLLSTVLTTPVASAASVNSLQQEKQQLESKKNTIKADISTKNNEIGTNQSSINSLTNQIQEITNKYEQTTQEIQKVEGEIAQTTQEIEKLQASILDLEQKIKERDIVLRERVRMIQVNGGSIDYLDVLLGANSFADFIDRVSAVTTIVDADRAIMKQQAEDQKKLEEEKALVEKKLAEQEASRAKLQELKNSLESQKQEKNRLVAELEKQTKQLEAEKEDLEHLFSETNAMSKELEQQIVAEQNRVAEQARLAAEAKKHQQAAQNNASSGGTSSSSGGSTSSAPAPSVSAGAWTRPASGTLTSGFGWRTHPIHGTKRQHRGLDIANSIGTPVVAAGDGVVSRASSHATLGNHIMITHYVNGQMYTTVYAHLSSMSVGGGQQVSKGQVIGRIGNTGASTGPHLHFEFHIGNFSGSGPSAVNPSSYVPF